MQDTVYFGTARFLFPLDCNVTILGVGVPYFGYNVQIERGQGEEQLQYTESLVEVEVLEHSRGH